MPLFGEWGIFQFAGSDLNFPRFDRVSKAEIYLIKPGRGSLWQRFKKPTHANSKRKQSGWSKPAESLSRRLPAMLPISDSAIHGWRKELTEHGKDAFPGKGHQTELEEENRRLKRELERVQQERDILKKAVGIFSRESKCAYQFIEQHKQEFPIVVMCRVLDVRGKWLLCLAQAPCLSAPPRRCPTYRRDSTGISRTFWQIRQPSPACRVA